MLEWLPESGFWLRAAALLGLCLLLLLLAVRGYQDRLIYLPNLGAQLPRRMGDNPRGYRCPSERGLGHVDVWVGGEGEKLHGWFLFAAGQPAAQRPTVVFFHENAGNIGTRLAFFEQYVLRCECNLLVVAYRGFGLSQGSPSERALRADALRILEYARGQQLFDAARVVLHGRSLGGAVLLSALRDPLYQALFPRLIVESSFTSLADVVDGLFPLLGRLPLLRRLLLRSAWDSAAAVAGLRSRELQALFIVGAEDRLTPPWMTQRLFELLGAPAKSLLSVAGAEHNDVWSAAPEKYFAQLRAFIAAAN